MPKLIAALERIRPDFQGVTFTKERVTVIYGCGLFNLPPSEVLKLSGNPQLEFDAYADARKQKP